MRRISDPEERMDYIVKIGLNLGYPRCCTQSFVFNRPFDTYQYEAAKLEGEPTGFIPCRECAKRIMSGEIKITDLIKNRKIPSPFPNAENTEEFEKLIKPLLY